MDFEYLNGESELDKYKSAEFDRKEIVICIKSGCMPYSAMELLIKFFKESVSIILISKRASKYRNRRYTLICHSRRQSVPNR